MLLEMKTFSAVLILRKGTLEIALEVESNKANFIILIFHIKLHSSVERASY